MFSLFSGLAFALEPDAKAEEKAGEKAEIKVEPMHFESTGIVSIGGKNIEYTATAGTLVMKNAQGRYAWIEVWFPDLNWMPFDPQATEMFVGSRFIRMAVGLDCGDAEKQGLIQWSEIKTPSSMILCVLCVSAFIPLRTKL